MPGMGAAQAKRAKAKVARMETMKERIVMSVGVGKESVGRRADERRRE